MVSAVHAQKLNCQLVSSPKHTGKLSPWEYALSVRKAVFTLCPIGRSNETIRLYEAFELGSIPIMLKGSEFVEDMFPPNHPVVILDSWTQLKSRMAELTQEPARLNELQRRVMSFWVRGLFFVFFPALLCSLAVCQGGPQAACAT
jgi:hypothetical protein